LRGVQVHLDRFVDGGEGALGVGDASVVKKWAELVLDLCEEELDGEVAPLLVAL